MVITRKYEGVQRRHSHSLKDEANIEKEALTVCLPGLLQLELARIQPWLRARSVGDSLGGTFQRAELAA